MARLSRHFVGGRWRVAIRGSLVADDLRRLECACAPALSSRPLPLDIHVTQLASLDDPSRLFLQRLLSRGAVLLGERREYWEEYLNGARSGR